VRRALSIALLLLAACNAGSSEEETAAAPASLEAATPVRAAEVTRGTVTVHVGGPGRTQALREVHVRAPFTGQLVALDVNDGDTVRAGAEIGAIVAQNSHAALEGAKAMVGSARTDAEKADAARALELAQANLVRQVLRTPAGGVVLSHKANAGDFVTEGDEIASLADASSIAFVAEIAQHDLPDIHPGAAATVELASARAPLAGIVHGLLPAGAESPSVPVRIDFARPGDARVGLFGTAAIVVAEHRDALLVPAAALLRDDVSGVSRIGVIADGGVLHWVAVTSGALADDQVEVAAPGLEAGARVAVSGHVGLPEGARVRVQS
jgi:RND family efflux transporter MFP subunit